METVRLHSAAPQAPASSRPVRDPAVQSWTLRWAGTRSILDRLGSGPATLDELAVLLPVAPASACRMLHNLASCGVVSWDGAHYRLGPVTRMRT